MNSRDPFQASHPHGLKINAAGSWQLRTQTLEFGKMPKIMGIVNVTPDSFSDGGKFFSPTAAIDHALSLVDEGADIIDIGGESTRPYALPVSAQEEIERVLPVIEALVATADIPVSIDTSKASVAREAIRVGAEIINDVTGLEGDAEMVSVALDSKAGICAMHMQGTPQTMQDNPNYDDVVSEIFEYLRLRRDSLISQGIDRPRICLDPGIGFGKTHQHNLTLMANCRRFHDLNCPILVGHSKKGFIGKVLGDKNMNRSAGTIGSAMVLAQNRIQVIRVHDVSEIRNALLLFTACGGVDGQERQID